jgi:hypothetical protein
MQALTKNIDPDYFNAVGVAKMLLQITASAIKVKLQNQCWRRWQYIQK